MKKYVIYDSQGAIERWGFCSNRASDDMKQERLKILLVPEVELGLDLTHKIIGIGEGETPRLVVKEAKDAKS